MSILEDLECYYESEDYLYEMASLGGDSTGLPLSLFFSPQPPNHKIRPIRFKVSDNPKKFMPTNSMVYSIDENEQGEAINVSSLTETKLPHKKERMLAMYILLNFETIKKYWQQETDTKSFVDEMEHISTQKPNKEDDDGAKNMG